MNKNKKKKKLAERDYLILELIRGATKAGIHVDRKKETNRKKCRNKKFEDD